MEEEENRNIFNEIETDQSAPIAIKEAVFSELKFLQNSSQVLDHFVGNYFKTLTSIFNKD